MITLKIDYDFDPTNPITDWSWDFEIILGRDGSVIDTSPNTFFDKSKKILWKEPIYKHEHGGIVVNRSPTCRFDSCLWGFAYMTKGNLEKLGRKQMSSKLAGTIDNQFESMLEVANQYFSGEIYYFSIENEEQSDSCGGFFGEDSEGMRYHFVQEEYFGENCADICKQAFDIAFENIGKELTFSLDSKNRDSDYRLGNSGWFIEN